jgi:hypothetical protein
MLRFEETKREVLAFLRIRDEKSVRAAVLVSYEQNFSASPSQLKFQRHSGTW